MKSIARVLLGAFLVFAGLSHLFWARSEFQAQVPTWVPLDADFVVLASGVVEVVLGLALIVLVRRSAPTGWIVAAFFVAVFPGNISQFLTHRRIRTGHRCEPGCPTPVPAAADRMGPVVHGRLANMALPIERGVAFPA